MSAKIRLDREAKPDECDRLGCQNKATHSGTAFGTNFLVCRDCAEEEGQSSVAAFQELRELVGDGLDAVDLDEFMEEMRSDRL